MRDRYTVPKNTPSKADLAFEELADKIIAYLSSPIPSAPDPPYHVGPCWSCSNDDCFAIAEPWAAPSIYSDGKAYITGGLCCAHHVGWAATDDCAHPMVRNDHE
jgi:hypothetical protein